MVLWRLGESRRGGGAPLAVVVVDVFVKKAPGEFNRKPSLVAESLVLGAPGRSKVAPPAPSIGGAENAAYFSYLPQPNSSFVGRVFSIGSHISRSISRDRIGACVGLRNSGSDGEGDSADTSRG